MPTRLAQLPTHASGTAALQISGPGAAQLPIPETVELAILQVGTVERYLDPRNPSDPWTTAVYRFRPLAPRREGGMLWLEIDYGVTYHLRANQPYKLLVRDPLTGIEIEERFTGPANMRRPSAPPQGWTPPPDPSGPVSAPPPAAPPPAPVTEPEPEPAPVEVAEPAVEALPEPAPTAPATPESARKRGAGLWIALAGLLVVVAAGLAWWMLQGKDGAQEAKAPAAADKAAGAESLESIRKFIAAGPDAGAATAKADELAKAGQLLDGQFLLYKYAGEKGDKSASLAMGRFYDPDLWSKEKSPLPAANPLEAARWYRQAAEAGDVEGQYRFGLALKKGRTDEPNAEEQAVVWLRRAAEAGHADAKKEIGQ